MFFLLSKVVFENKCQLCSILFCSSPVQAVYKSILFNILEELLDSINWRERNDLGPKLKEFFEKVSYFIKGLRLKIMKWKRLEIKKSEIIKKTSAFN